MMRVVLGVSIFLIAAAPAGRAMPIANIDVDGVTPHNLMHVQKETMVVERGRVGPIAIDSSAYAIYDKFQGRVQLVDLKLEGTLSPALEVKLFGSQLVPSVIAEIGPTKDGLVITRINVIDPTLRTKDGIGVGSTYGELRSRYSVDWIASGEGSVGARVEKLSMTFALDTSGPRPLWAIRDPAQVPNEVRVTAIMLTR